MLLSEIIARLGGELRGADVDVNEVAPLDAARSDAIAYLANPKLKGLLSQAQVAAVIVRPQDAEGIEKPAILTRDTHTYFAKVAQLFHPLPQARAGIHPSAIVAADAVVDPSAEIGPLVVIESGAKIGARTILKAGVAIGENAVIGDDVILYPRVVVYSDTVIGARVIVHAGTVLGSDGFGNAWDRDHWEKIPQIGRAIIGDDVEIGANTTIDRGAMGDTVIAAGARIDNLIQIGHNVKIGAHTAMAACSGIAGSTVIGANCLIGGGVGMAGHLKIADRVTILGGSDVPSSIEEAGVYGGPNSIQPHQTWLRNAVHLRKLDEIVKRVRALEKRLPSADAQAE